MQETRSSEKQLHQLYDLLASLQSEEEVKALLEDLCTYKELEHMAQRVESARLLLSGCTYQQVYERVSVSSATLSRINRCVQYGNGYNGVLKRYLENQKEKEKGM